MKTFNVKMESVLTRMAEIETDNYVPGAIGVNGEVFPPVYGGDASSEYVENHLTVTELLQDYIELLKALKNSLKGHAPISVLSKYQYKIDEASAWCEIALEQAS